jgi:anti-anti-sigma regulatory factor
MITIKKISEGVYEAAFQKPAPAIDKHSGYHLKKEVGKIINTHRKIFIDLKKVNSIDEHALKMLEQLCMMADKKNCGLEFKNIGSDIAGKIREIRQVKTNI